jgi:hypothetical protein
MRRERLIRRYEHNYFRGWLVCIKRQGTRYEKYFSDKPDGRADALRRARRFREQLLKRLPIASKVKRTYVRNTTGEIGVALVRQRARSGRLIRRYVAQWPTPDGRRAKASFSVIYHGEAKARRLAIKARRAGLARLFASRM